MSLRLVDLVVPASCWACRAPAPAAASLCEPCERALPWVGVAPAPEGLGTLGVPMALDGPARALVHALKFRGAAGVARLMAEHIAAVAEPAGVLDPPAALVPVPASRLRARIRGYDHAELLARSLGELSGRPVVGSLSRAGPLLSRQRGLGRNARLEGAAVCVDARGPVPRVCVLVDDVHTTGATLAACAAALRRAGAARVSAVAYAREL
jgi:ComF family protein